MKAIDFKQANITLAPPAGRPDVAPLRVCRDKNTAVSLWQASWKEWFRFIFTRKVWLWVEAKGHPPVLITIEDPKWE